MSTLYRKYRPITFQEISGQEYVIKTLTNAIKNDRVSQAYLFTGPRGTGKTTTARIFAKAVNCLDPITKTDNPIATLEPCNKCSNCQTILKNQAMDLIEIDAASHTGVDNIRQLKEAINVPPTNFRYKVYIIDEVHMLSMGAFNALLKTLEEPPGHAIFILATTELHKVPETILSRCQRFNIKPLTKQQIIERLQQIAKKEEVKIGAESLNLIATEANGGMRDAESLLGQIIALGNKKITTTEVENTLGSSSKRALLNLVHSIAENNLPKIIKIINQTQTDGINIKTFNNQLLNYFRDLMLLKISPEANEELLKKLTTEEISRLKEMGKSFSIQNVILLISLLQTAQSKNNQSDIPQLPLEMALVEYSLKTTPLKEAVDQNNSLKKKTQSNQKIFPKDTSQKNPLPPENGLKKINPTDTSHHSPKKKQQTNINQTTSSTKSDNTLSQDQNKNHSPKKETSSATQDSGLSPLLSINTFLDNWSEILTEVQTKNSSVSAFLKNCAPTKIIGQEIIIKTKYSFHKDKLSEQTNKLTIEKIFAKILKVPLKVKFVTEEEIQSFINDTDNTESTARNRKKAPEKKTSSSTDNIKTVADDKDTSVQTATTNDDLLYEAMKSVGGKIIED